MGALGGQAVKEEVKLLLRRYTVERSITPSGIAVHATQQIVRTEIGDEDGEEGDDHVEMVEAG